MEIRRGQFMLDAADDGFPAQGTSREIKCWGSLAYAPTGRCFGTSVAQALSYLDVSCSGGCEMAGAPAEEARGGERGEHCIVWACKCQMTSSSSSIWLRSSGPELGKARLRRLTLE